MKFTAYSAIALVVISTCLAFGNEIVSPWKNEAKVWEKHKEEVYEVFERLVLPPKGTSTREVKKVFEGNVTEEETEKPGTTRLTATLFLCGDIDHPRNKMYCLIRLTAVDGKVTESRVAFTAPGFLNIDGKKVKDPHETDYKLVGILRGYLAWKDNLSEASWNRAPDKASAADADKPRR